MISPQKTGEGAGKKKPSTSRSVPAIPKDRPATRESSTAGRVGGQKRQKGTDNRHLGSPIRAIPPEFAVANKFRFPTDPATPAQERSLETLINTYLRRQFIHLFREAGADAIARVLNVTQRSGLNYLKDDAAAGDPWWELTLDLLVGMYSGRYAGPMGYRSTTETCWIFDRVAYGDLRRPRFGPTNDAAAIRQLHAAFKIDVNKLRKARQK